MATKTLLGTSVMAALCSGPLHAQEAQPARGLEEIIVYATRIDRTLENVPAAVSVVGQDVIQLANPQLTLDESLRRVPGLFMQNQHNFAQDLRMSIRGFGARANFGIRGIKILVDGIPETLPDGQGSVDSIDIGATSQIEVIRGPSSSMYGNASGGVIAVTTEQPPEEPFGEARLAGGEYGYQQMQFKVGGQTERVGYLVNLADTDLDGYREQSRYENRQLTGRFNFDLGSDRELLTVVNFTDQPVSEDPGGVTAEQAAQAPRTARDANLLFDGGEALEQQRLGFVYSMPLGEGHEITARNYYIWRDFENSLPFQGGGIVAFDRFFAGGGFTYGYDGTWLGRPNRLVVGFDYDVQDDDRLRFNNDFGTRGDLVFDQNETVSSRGIFLQNQLTLAENVDLSFGLRYDEVEFDVTDRFLADGDDSGRRTLDDLSPMLGVTVGLAEQTTLYATYSTAFETPTTTEFNDPTGGGGFNPNLDPQVATNLEVGLRGFVSGRSRYQLALFTIDVEDELIPFEVPGSPGRDFFANAGESTRDGFEASLISNLTERLQTTLAYTYSDFVFEDFREGDGPNFAGNTIPGTADHVFFGEIAYHHPRGWFGAFDVTHIGEQYANNANTAINDAYTLANVRFGSAHDVGSLVIEPFLGINNLFDEDYNANVRINSFGGRFFEAGPDRNLYAGVTLSFPFE